MIIKKVFQCKENSYSLFYWGGDEVIDFIKGKLYEIEFDDTHPTRYYVVNESGRKLEYSKPHMNVIFHIDIQERRDRLINDIISS